MELYELDYDDDGEYRLDLTPDTLADLTGLDLDRLQGMFGAGVVGQLTISQDMDTYWDDVDNLEGTGLGLFVEPSDHSRGYTCESQYGPELDWFADALDRIAESYPYGLDDYAQRVLTRYAALRGHTVRFETLSGMAQGDWLDVVAVYPNERDDSFVQQYRDYWAGEIHGYDITITDPLGGAAHEDSCWGLVGDTWVMKEAADSARYLIESVSDEIRSAKAGAA